MNDPQEMLHGKDTLTILLPFLESFWQLPSENRLDVRNLDMEKLLYDYSSTPFVLSFSKNEDDLSMWTMYGDKGCGVALQFDMGIKSHSLLGQKNSGLVKVNYNMGVNNYPDFVNILNSGIIEWRNPQDEQEIKKCKERTLSRLFNYLCPYIKSEAYKYENEYRLCINNVPNDVVRFRLRNKNIIPFDEVPIPIRYLKGIWLGPCCNMNINNVSLGYLLECCNLGNVKIINSDLPYRNV